MRESEFLPLLLVTVRRGSRAAELHALRHVLLQRKWLFGHLQVAAAAAEGHRVVPVPGPSAVLAALVASGLPTAEFMFIGFLPAKQTARLHKLRQLAGEPHLRLLLSQSPRRSCGFVAMWTITLAGAGCGKGSSVMMSLEPLQSTGSTNT